MSEVTVDDALAVIDAEVSRWDEVYDGLRGSLHVRDVADRCVRCAGGASRDPE